MEYKELQFDVFSFLYKRTLLNMFNDSLIKIKEYLYLVFTISIYFLDDIFLPEEFSRNEMTSYIRVLSLS